MTSLLHAKRFRTKKNQLEGMILIAESKKSIYIYYFYAFIHIFISLYNA